MFTINYNYSVGETLWITDDDEEVYDAFLVKVVLEIDHDENQEIIEKRSYHLLIRESPDNIVVKSQEEVFGTAGDAVRFLNNNELTAPEINTYNETYDYTVGDTVWIIIDNLAVECTNTQTTISIVDLGETNLTEKIYHLLPSNNTHSVILKTSDLIYSTKESAIHAIKDRYLF
jgi:hypothetical protein